MTPGMRSISVTVEAEINGDGEITAFRVNSDGVRTLAAGSSKSLASVACRIGECICESLRLQAAAANPSHGRKAQP